MRNVGIRIKMLTIQWARGPLPADPEKICNLISSKKPPPEAILKEFPVGDDGLRACGWLEEQRMKQKAFRESRAENANSRWRRDRNEARRPVEESMCNARASDAGALPVQGVEDAPPMHVHPPCTSKCNALHSSSSCTHTHTLNAPGISECVAFAREYLPSDPGLAESVGRQFHSQFKIKHWFTSNGDNLLVDEAWKLRLAQMIEEEWRKFRKPMPGTKKEKFVRPDIHENLKIPEL